MCKLENTRATYFGQRGMATHTPLIDVFAGQQPHWHSLKNMKPKHLKRALPTLLEKSRENGVQKFYQNQKHFHAWVAGVYKILLKVLNDWQVEHVLLVEPRLETLVLPNGDILKFGSPDLCLYSPLFDGCVGVEIKTGAKFRPPMLKRINHNTLGLMRMLAREGLPPLRSFVWMSFAADAHKAHKVCMQMDTFPVQENELLAWLAHAYPASVDHVHIPMNAPMERAVASSLTTFKKGHPHLQVAFFLGMKAIQKH